MKSRTNTISLLALSLALTFGAPSVLFAYQAAPIAISKNATFITEQGAKLNGQVNPNEMADAVAWFEWGISGRPEVVYQTAHQSVWGWNGNVLVDFNADIIGLAPSTQYFYRQVIESSRGKDVGQTVYLTTKALTPDAPPTVIVETVNPSVVGETTATLRGYVSPHEDRDTRAWFEWGISQRFESQTQPVGVSPSAGYFESGLSNLTPGTVYFYRIVGENSAGRTTGATRVFTTAGTPPPPPEQPISQQLPSGGSGSAGISRTTTSSGGAGLAINQGVSNSNRVDGSVGLPGVFADNLPGDFFGLFRKKTAPASSGANTGSPSNAANSANSNVAATGGISPDQQVAGVAETSSPLGTLWSALTGSKATDVTIEKVGPTNIPMHTPVEYRITYHYRDSAVATGAKLKITIPSDVIYIGDNTNNELLLEEGAGKERTYVLPIGRLEKGATRTLSILGMTTGSANGFPDAKASMEYESDGGMHIISAVGATAGSGANTAVTKSQTATAAGAGGGGILPSSFFGWLLYVLFVVLAIIGIRKGREFYEKRKEAIEAMDKEDDNARLARMLPSVSAPLEA